MWTSKSWTRALAGCALAALAGCSDAYYESLELVGIEKRHVLTDRVEEAKDDQAEAKEQFRTALERFKELTGFDGGDLEKTYRALADEYAECEERAEDVRDRIESIETVADDLFEEWDDEIEAISRPEYRTESRRLLSETRVRCSELLRSMRRAEHTMAPVLQAFRDQVLFLKHNLNTKAIAHLQGVAVEIESDVDILIAEMERSIAEADRFLETMTPED